MQESHYVGRFAPSPSGDLHFGSLIAALGSYLQARAQRGQWLVRIEDIDPPREVPGAAARILSALEHYGLHWDGQVIYQSQRHDAYRAALDLLQRQGLSYYCTCTRSRIQHIGGLYDGHCRDLQLGPQGAAIRLRQTAPVYGFHDRLQGELHADPALAGEDFIIRRRDGLFAYNLAVVIDDHFQGVTEIVRGSDRTDGASNCPLPPAAGAGARLCASAAGAGRQRHQAVEAKSCAGVARRRSAPGADRRAEISAPTAAGKLARS